MIFTNNFDPIMLEVGPIAMRWYGFIFALGIMAYYGLISWIWKREKYSEKHLEGLILYMFFGLVIGARMGHVLFYNAGYYFAEPVRILKIWEGGLASHGAALGLLVAFAAWCWKNKVKFSKYVDAIAIPMALTAAFVRLGNFFNSEIIGTPTNGEWGVIYARLNEDFPRHPVQFYEMGVTLFAFAVIMWLYLKKYKEKPPMFILGVYLAIYFTGRIVAEAWKARQIVPESIPLSMGQMLSIIPVLIGLVLIFKGGKKREV